MQTSFSAYGAAARHATALPSGTGRLRRSLPVRLSAFLLAAGLLLLSAADARAFQIVQPPAQPAQQTTTSSPPSSADGQCLSLLKALPADTGASAMDRNRRSADETAAFGLVFGIRFALDSGDVRKPSRRPSAPRFEIRQPGVTGDPHALAVADYNRCKSDQALKALGDEWRWSR